jgi:hypothetical protein
MFSDTPIFDIESRVIASGPPASVSSTNADGVYSFTIWPARNPATGQEYILIEVVQPSGQTTRRLLRPTDLPELQPSLRK